MSGRWVRGERWIGLLLRLFPRSFGERYGAEMLETHREVMSAARTRGHRALVLQLLRTSIDLVASSISLRLNDGAHRLPRSSSARMSAGGVMDRLLQDLRFAFRFLSRNLLYTVTVLATLALGIGMNTAVFSVLYGVLYKPLPYPDPDELVQVGRTHPNVPDALLPLSPAGFLDMRERVGRVVQLEAETGTGYVLTDGDVAVRQQGSRVTAGFFDLLGVTAARGRTFRAGEDAAGAEKVVVLSDVLWREQFGASEDVPGRVIELNETPHTIVGIMPRDFQFGRAQLWTPLEWTSELTSLRESNFLNSYGRLVDGATVEQATAELARLWVPLRAEFPEGNVDTDMAAQRVDGILGEASRTPLFIVAGAAAFLLLIACANVANLTLVRAEYRQRELGVRAALGAEPHQIARQFVTESVLVAMMGGAIGVVVAHAGVRALIGTFGAAVPRAHEIGIHVPVLLFTFVAALLTGLLVGLAPALRMRADFDALRTGGRGGARMTGVGRLLVVGEVALALMLVIAAGLLLKSYDRAMHSDLGLRADELIAANLWFPASRYADTAPADAFMAEFLARLEARPVVQGAALVNMVPIREFGANWTEMTVVGRPDTKASFVEGRSVSPDFFETVGMHLLRGRYPTATEAGDRAAVTLINETLATQLFGARDPVGERLHSGSSEREIIGVVSDLRDLSPDRAPAPTLYQPTSFTPTIMIRTHGSVAAVADAVRATLAAVDPQVRLIRIEHMTEIADAALSGRRFQLTLIGVFGFTALLLASVGIYGVLSYTVTRQTREIGVRMALGARASAVAGLIAWRGGRLALAGASIGLALAAGVTRVLESQLFEVGTLDAGVYMAVTASLLGVAAAACWLPARRAASVQPTQALRME